MAEFYLRAAHALQDILAHRGSIKAIAAQTAAGGDARAHGNARRVLALVVNALAYREALTHVLDAVGIAHKEAKWFGPKSPLNRGGGGGRAAGAPPTSQCVLLLLTHDLLFERRGIQAARAWPPRERLERHKSQLHAELVRLQLRRRCTRAEDLRAGAAERALAERIPRWVRVNTLRMSAEAAEAAFAALGLVRTNSTTLANPQEYARSTHVAHVYAFHPRASAKLAASALYRDGAIMFQDLASCMPAAVLAATGAPPACALDATAAPGNKTSHLGALMRGAGTLYAFERAPPRHRTLVRMLQRAGCVRPHGNVEALQQDFLAADPADYADVTHLLLDPSCSGSGIVNRLDYLTQADDEQDNLEDVVPGEARVAERLSALAALQTRMIVHAMEFPALTRFTYSTCSVHAAEDEHVVAAALDSPVARARGWRLAPRAEVLPTWPHRGRADEAPAAALADCMVRCMPGGAAACAPGAVHTEASIGFFVCCFVRGDGAQPAQPAQPARPPKRARRS